MTAATWWRGRAADAWLPVRRRLDQRILLFNCGDTTFRASCMMWWWRWWWWCMNLLKISLQLSPNCPDVFIRMQSSSTVFWSQVLINVFVQDAGDKFTVHKMVSETVVLRGGRWWWCRMCCGFGGFYWKFGHRTLPTARRSLVGLAGRICSACCTVKEGVDLLDVCCSDEPASCHWCH